MLDRVSNMSQASDRRLLEFVWGLNSDELKKKKMVSSKQWQSACLYLPNQEGEKLQRQQ